jgi:hypothetical protein
MHQVSGIKYAGFFLASEDGCYDLLTVYSMAITQVRQRHSATYKSEVPVHNKTLGHLRLRDAETNEIILVPTPSSDPKDPLNW